MAISYVSEIIKSNSFRDPFSLELMGKVNAYKQSMFYANANKLENAISGLKNIDILNPEQKSRAQLLTNNLVSQLNNMGAMDYSDMNVSNTLESYAATVYQDEQVLKGVASTAQARKLMSNIERLKTDPKLMKYYNPGNEAYAMRAVDKYIKGGAQATFEGETSPTPYKGNPYTRLMDAVKKIMPDIEVKFTDSGNPFFIQKSINKSVDEDKVYNTIAGTVDADLLKQVQIDSWYNMRGMTPEQTLETYNNNYNQRKDSLDGLKTYYEKAIKEEPLESVKAEYQRELDDINNRLTTLKNGYSPKEIAKQIQTEEGLENVWYGMYRNSLFDNVVKSGAYKQKDADLIVNQQKVFEAKKELEMFKASLKATSTSKGKNADGTPNNMPGNIGELGLNTQTDEEAKANQVTLKTFEQKNTQLELNISKTIHDFLEENISLNPEYAALFPETTIASDNPNSGPTQQIHTILDVIRKLDNNPNLSVDDIRSALKYGQLALTSKNAVVPGTNIPVSKVALTPSQTKFFQNMVNIFDKAATGKLNDVDFESLKVNKSEALQVANRVRFYQMGIQANKDYVKTIKDQVIGNISAADRKLYEEYLNNPNDPKYVKTGYISAGASYTMGTTQTPSATFTELGKRMNDIDRQFGLGSKKVQELLNNDENRPNFWGLNFNQKALKDAEIDIATNIASSNSPNRPSDLGSIEDIQPTNIQKDETTGQWIINYRYKNNKGKWIASNSKTAYVAPPSLVQQLGITEVKYPELNGYMRYKKTSESLYTYNPALPGAKGVFKYDLVRLGDGRNPKGFVIRFYDDKGGIIQVKEGYAQKPFMSPDQAVTFAETVTSPQTFADSFNNNRDYFFQSIAYAAYKNIIQ